MPLQSRASAPRPTTLAIRKALPRERTRTSGLLSAHVAARLREAIMDGRFRLGEALSELKLAAAFEVSRTPVREALTELQREGLIEIRPQSGSFVFQPSGEDVAELALFRRVIEVAALRFCFARRRAEALREMREATERMERAREAGRRLELAQADTAFHAAIARNSANDYLIGAYQLIAGRVAALRTHNLMAAEVVRTKSLAEHRALIAAFARGDLERAEAVLAEHVWHLRVRYLSTSRPGNDAAAD